MAGSAVLERVPALEPDEYGYYLGEAVRPETGQSLYSPYDQALRVIGPMGSGKTFRYLARVARRCPGAALLASTKPDIVELTLGARVKRGPVVSLDAQGVCPGLEPLRLSPIHGAEDTEVASMRAAAFVAGAGASPAAKSDGGDDASSFYKDQAATVLECLLHAAALDGASLRDVLKWAARFSDPAPRVILDQHPGAGIGWAENLVRATTGDERKVTNTMSTLARALASFKHAEVVNAVDVAPERATDIEALLAARGTVYLLGKDNPYLSIAPLITAMVEDVLDRAERLANTLEFRRLDPPLLVGLDEVANAAPIPSLRQRVADGRARGLAVQYFVQGWASAEARFGRDVAKELASFTNNTLVFGGVGDPAFLEEMSKRAGQVRVFRTSTSSGSGRGSGPSSNVGEDWQPVLRAHQIGQLEVDLGEALLLASNLPPVITRLPMLKEDEDWPQIQEEVRQVRAMADAARALARAEKDRSMRANAAAWNEQKESGR
ncbi:type IV secretory system conjugative DNA transfer family protein [Kitasatospora sp. NPDC087861]|uniref:type IV secretory system conjugative DNA transfer family protein n=1 Tax=Kitasatospora sp. NPDC087861 TaxID=3364070 RepID=UPI00380B10CE